MLGRQTKCEEYIDVQSSRRDDSSIEQPGVGRYAWAAVRSGDRFFDGTQQRRDDSMRGEVMARAYIFGPYFLVPERQALMCDRGLVRVGGRALDLLTTLVARAGEIVSKNDLMASAWPRVTVDENNLKVHMSALRRALGDCPETPTYIATIPGRGYRFVSPVKHGSVADFPRGDSPNLSFHASIDEARDLQPHLGEVATRWLDKMIWFGSSSAPTEIIVRDENVSLHFKFDRIEAPPRR